MKKNPKSNHYLMPPGRVVSIPRIYSGKPTVEGAPVDIIYGRFISGETVDEIAVDYGIGIESVKAAIRHEKKRRQENEGEAQ